MFRDIKKYVTNTFSYVTNRRKYLCFLIALFSTLPGAAQSAYHNYIKEYADLAIEQMRLYKIPASITLAQGLLESSAGQSKLATKANNHFGIKKGMNWSGPTMKHDDDERNERFRKYKSARDSYEDHSRFLTGGLRYSFLFDLDINDYKGWAHGLKKAGYATNPRYAYQLIDIIERYKLYRFDITKGSAEQWRYTMRKCNDRYYIIAQEGDTYKTLAKIFDLSRRKLRKYNEVGKFYQLKAGSIVYLQKKQKKAHKSLKGHFHVVQPGESLHHISQMYGMRVKTLYKLNDLTEDYVPRIGSVLRIR